MTEPAPLTAQRKVVLALAAALDAIPGLAVYADRHDDEATDETERPCVIPVVRDTGFSTPVNGTTQHTATIDLEIHTDGGAFGSVDARQAMFAAQIVAVLAADRSLGGMLMDLEEQSLSPADGMTADLGCAVLGLNVVWFTARGDHFTIQGQSGPF